MDNNIICLSALLWGPHETIMAQCLAHSKYYVNVSCCCFCYTLLWTLIFKEKWQWTMKLPENDNAAGILASLIMDSSSKNLYHQILSTSGIRANLSYNLIAVLLNWWMKEGEHKKRWLFSLPKEERKRIKPNNDVKTQGKSTIKYYMLI